MEFEIFSSGQQTSDKGITKDYSTDDLKYIASNYNPSESEAPIVIGHPVDSGVLDWFDCIHRIFDRKINYPG